MAHELGYAKFWMQVLLNDTKILLNGEMEVEYKGSCTTAIQFQDYININENIERKTQSPFERG